MGHHRLHAVVWRTVAARWAGRGRGWPKARPAGRPGRLYGGICPEWRGHWSGHARRRPRAAGSLRRTPGTYRLVSPGRDVYAAGRPCQSVRRVRRDRRQRGCRWAGPGRGAGPVPRLALVCLYINVPIAAVAAVGGWLTIADSRPAWRPRFDLPGLFLGVGGLMALVYGCGEIGR